MAMKVLLFVFAFAVMSCAAGDETNKGDEELEHQSNVIPQSTGHPRQTLADLGIPSGLISMVANGGVVAAMVLAASAILVLIAPVFGIRLCNIFGNCNDSLAYQAYSSAPSGVYDYQGYQQGTYNSPVYQKRSLEYIGPILKALGNAYEKYNRQGTTYQTTPAKTA